MAKKCLIEKHKRMSATWARYEAELKKAQELPKEQRERKVAEIEARRVKNRVYKTRQYTRCSITGRSKGYVRYFGLCRQQLREMAHQGLLPGVVKSSW